MDRRTWSKERGRAAQALGLALIVGGLAGCGGSEPTQANASNGKPSETQAESAAPKARAAGQLASLLAAGDPRTFENLERRAGLTPNTHAEALSAEDSAAWVAALPELRASFSKLGAVTRTRLTSLVGGMIVRYGVAPAPADWNAALAPSGDMLLEALGDAEPPVRVAALDALAHAWSWMPACSLWPDQERGVAMWKDTLHPPLVRLLDDPVPGVRLAAVKAMAALPVDAIAAPAVARLNDENPLIRLETLKGFALRPEVLTVDDILPRLHDKEEGVAVTARIVLRNRGLSTEQIDLARAVYSPAADQRLGAVEQLASRNDVDPVVWLIHLTHDTEDNVRTRALAALAKQTSPDARRRMAEMATSDPSEAIRTEAKRLAPANATAGLPPLPGRADLTPKAN